MEERALKFMKMAIELSHLGHRTDKGGPFGAIVVKGDEVVGRGYNQVTSSNDPTAHAEVVAIRDACKTLNTFQLEGCEIYTSCEPCPMCLGAIYWARPDKIYFANTREDAAAIGFDDSMIYEEMKKQMNERKIPIIQIGQDLAIKAFHEWKEKEDKKEY
jgi:guanine deaminase